MKKRYFIFLVLLLFVFAGCKTVSKKVDKTVSEEEKKLSKFLNNRIFEHYFYKKYSKVCLNKNNLMLFEMFYFSIYF